MCCKRVSFYHEFLEINHALYCIASSNELNPSLVQVSGWLHPQ